MHSIILF
ncbi:hypothetical protein Pint_28029 [Pistacia integerrima]|nr:hypothetical protein Pint_28029 [Pistacia integerrima]